MNPLHLLAVNLTSRCNLACSHCYMDADTRRTGERNELTSGEVMQLLETIASRGNETMVVLTGGEPLLRRDLESLIAHGSELGLSMVVGSNGVLLDASRVNSLKRAGVMGIGISLDSLDPDYHNRFRGCPGSWEKTLAGIDHCRQQGLPFQIHFSVTDQNAHEVAAMIDFASSAGAHVLNLFFLVCTGRGESMSDISPQRYEQVLNQLVEAQSDHPNLMIRARCAPHFKRVLYQNDPQSPLTRAEGYDGGGCPAGIHYCRVTPTGAVTACPYIPDEQGSIRDTAFWEIWDRAPQMQSLREPQLNGKCGVCEYRKLCGGCRARPLALARAANSSEVTPTLFLGNEAELLTTHRLGQGEALMDSDPWCHYEPTGGEPIQPYSDTSVKALIWSPEAKTRLQRVPGFVRRMVRLRTERYVTDLGESEVTVEHMQQLARSRFGGRMPTAPNFIPSGETGQNSSLVNRPTQLNWSRQAETHIAGLPREQQEPTSSQAETLAEQLGLHTVTTGLLTQLTANRQASQTENEQADHRGTGTGCAGEP